MHQPKNFIPIIIDLEASGFGKGCYPIEVGVAMADGTTHCYLIKPHRDWTHWREESEKLHGISREVLQKHGRDVKEVADKLNQLLEGSTVYSDSWGFDNTWISLLFDAAQCPQKFKVGQLQVLFNEEQYNNWHQIHQEVMTELNITRHRASSDAFLIQQTFVRSSGARS